MPEAIHEEASGRWFRPGGIIMMIAGAVLLVAAVPLAWGPDSPLGSLAGPLLEPLLVALFSLVFFLVFVGAMLNFENRNVPPGTPTVVPTGLKRRDSLVP